MVYLFTDGRTLYDDSLLRVEDAGQYLALEKLPTMPSVEGKAWSITGCNLETGEFLTDYYALPEPIPEPIPQPTETEILMQSFAGLELQNLEIQQGQQLLAQQLTDLELALPK